MRRLVALTRAAVLVPAVALLVAACGAPPAGESEGPVRTAESLRAVPAELSAGATTLTLEVEAWRSFQPTMDSVENRLIAILRVNAAGGGVPGALAVDTVWLVHGSEVVQGGAREEQSREPGASSVEFVLRDGPMWAPGDSIDVVALVSGVNGRTATLRAPRIVIERVD
ncbi:MAG: hypothetical protein IPG88_09915 [Gemmatimonadetes bacterium]|nr:hypothetical protein [Gemmatimonadota bacterium]